MILIFPQKWCKKFLS